MPQRADTADTMAHAAVAAAGQFGAVQNVGD